MARRPSCRRCAASARCSACRAASSTGWKASARSPAPTRWPTVSSGRSPAPRACGGISGLRSRTRGTSRSTCSSPLKRTAMGMPGSGCSLPRPRSPRASWRNRRRRCPRDRSGRPPSRWRPAPRSGGPRRPAARRSTGSASAQTASSPGTGSSRRRSPTGTGSTSRPRTLPFRTSRSSWPASGSRPARATGRRRHERVGARRAADRGADDPVSGRGGDGPRRLARAAPRRPGGGWRGRRARRSLPDRSHRHRGPRDRRRLPAVRPLFSVRARRAGPARLAARVRMGGVCPRGRGAAAGPRLRPFPPDPRRGRRGLRRVPARGQAAERPVLQHAPARLLRHADAAERRHPRGRRPGDRAHALAARPGLRGDAGAQAGRGRRRVRALRRGVRAELRVRRRGRRGDPRGRDGAGQSSAAAGDPARAARGHRPSSLSRAALARGRAAPGPPGGGRAVMLPQALLVAFFLACAAGMVLAAVLPDRRAPAAIAWVGAAAAAAALASGGGVLATGHVVQARLWSLAPAGTLVLALDRFSAVFVVVTACVYLAVSLFSAGYLPRYLGHYSLRSFGIAFASMRGAAAGLGAGARWAVLLLAFFGFGVKAGLVPTSTWLPRAHPAAPGNVSALLSGVILNLGMYGIMRVNLDLLPVASVGPGILALIVGTLSALVGILYATTQTDTKTMLAHSSIENMGIVAAALGAGLVFAASGRPVLAGIADVVALYHLGNHALYKALLFLGAGSVDLAAGERDMDRLGGLIRRMPWTALWFLVGSLSIAAMPPTNGFASEWLLLQTLLRSVELSAVSIRIVFALCGAALALTAALAVTCFVRAFAMSFLGIPRSSASRQATEVPRSMTAAMGLLAAGCLAAGVAATGIIPVLDGAVAPLVHARAAGALVPPFFAPGAGGLPPAFVAEFRDLGAEVGKGIVPGPGLVVLHRGGARNPVVFAMSTAYTLAMLLLLLGAAAGAVAIATRARAVTRRRCWDGGLPRLLPAMTYTATGFSNPVRVIFGAVFHPSAPEDTVEVVAGHFRTAVRRSRPEVHVVDRAVFDPATRAAWRVARALAGMHHGRINAYAAYVLATLLAFLVAGRLL